MKKLILKIVKALLIVYILICGLLYLFQEKIIFLPEKLQSDYRFHFDQKFEEIGIKSTDGKILNSILFKVDKPKGLIFYLHGNAGSLKTWGEIAETYRYFNYDVFMLDYRGYGKSEGSISSEKQMFDDIQTAYDYLKSKYEEKEIIVLGYSIGTGPAAKLASANNPRLLILQAPYYSLTDMMQHRYPLIPTFLLKYKFETNKYIKNCNMPVVVFHGTNDKVIYYGSSLKLKKLFKASDTLFTLKRERHEGISENFEYLSEMNKILE